MKRKRKLVITWHANCVSRRHRSVTAEQFVVPRYDLFAQGAFYILPRVRIIALLFLKLQSQFAWHIVIQDVIIRPDLIMKCDSTHARRTCRGNAKQLKQPKTEIDLALVLIALVPLPEMRTRLENGRPRDDRDYINYYINDQLSTKAETA
jgi:hypothetical protein